MAISPAKRFQRLDALLSRLGAGDGCMRLSELDGFIAGIAVCPELVRPTEWLPLIWGRAGPGFQSDREAQEVRDLIMGRYNEVLQSLAEPGKYQPILNEERAGVVIWELWASGFHKAVRLRPRSWEAFTESSDRDVRRAISGLLRIAEIAAGDATASVDLDRLLHENAAEFIGASVGALHQARIARQVGLRDPAQTPAMSVGRNDPCPCGSGKKFKHCCLN